MGELAFWLQKIQGGWRVGWVYLATDETPNPADAAVSWQRFAMPGAELRLSPAMPDSPVVLRPALPLTVFPGHVEKVYVSVPVTLRIEGGDPPPCTLRELPTRRLSLSWFGNNTKEGRLCLSLKTRARDVCPTAEDPGAAHRVICPLEVENASRETRAFERFCLHTPRMGIYMDGRGLLWGNRCRVTYRGTGAREEAFLDSGAPVESNPFERVATPREEDTGGGLPGILSFLS